MLYVTTRGLTTLAIPRGAQTFQIDFDFCTHELRILTSGAERSVRLYPRSVADFYAEVTATLDSMGFPVRIWTMPVEIPDPVPFPDDHEHSTYDRDEVHRLWQALVQANRVMSIFARRYVGKASPVHALGSPGHGGHALLRRGAPHTGVPGWRTGSPVRPIRTRSAAAGSGRGTPGQPPSFIRSPTPATRLL